LHDGHQLASVSQRAGADRDEIGKRHIRQPTITSRAPRRRRHRRADPEDRWARFSPFAEAVTDEAKGMKSPGTPRHSQQVASHSAFTRLLVMGQI
jgi:hypothetical protein